MRLILLFLAAMLPAAAMSSDFVEGENLITPYKLDAGKWDVLQKNEPGLKSMMWRSKDKGMGDAYVVNIYSGSIEALGYIREVQDAPGKERCGSFQSIDLKPIPNQSYESILWRTVCSTGENFKAQILQLVIKGNDSVYHLQKIWRGDVSESEMNEWINTFTKVYLCDTRKPEKACPAGYERAKTP